MEMLKMKDETGTIYSLYIFMVCYTRLFGQCYMFMNTNKIYVLTKLPLLLWKPLWTLLALTTKFVLLQDYIVLLTTNLRTLLIIFKKSFSIYFYHYFPNIFNLWLHVPFLNVWLDKNMKIVTTSLTDQRFILWSWNRCLGWERIVLVS